LRFSRTCVDTFLPKIARRTTCSIKNEIEKRERMLDNSCKEFDDRI